ncbi:MAG: DNA gyrase subunit A [Eubacteriales bacterium]|nr:DNA gyrase subunit A [Faecalibacterium sp.]MDY6150752.1 DNA gyrase subunit A [Eubacteriales bacterium]
MAKEIIHRDFVEHLAQSKIVKVEVESEIKKSFIAYAMAVNVSRAIPDVRDGLKPVHRRILYSMNELNLTSDKPYRKCALIVGDVLGKYHPHGDSSVYDALVRLAQDFSIRCPLIDGHGNFGSVDGDPAAAYRYTEARLSKIANEMIRDIDKKTVDFCPNFDDTREQPTVLPARYPNLLVNGSDGIAVGMATSIPPHNLGEVIDATVALIDNPDLEVEDLMEFVPGPDFPTGATILGRAAIRQAYKTGRGGCVIRAKCDIEEKENGRESLVFTEIPYQVNKARLIENIADQVKDKRLEGISDIKEESDRHGMRIVIDVKKDANAQVVLNNLYKQTQLQINYSMIMLALVDGTPRILNLKEILAAYIKHQEDVVTRRTRFDLERAQEREHILKGLAIAEANIDEVIQIIKTASDRVDAQAKLIERFLLSDAQANAILEMRVYRLTALEVDKINAELEDKEREIADYQDILANIGRVNEIIKTEMLDIKARYNTPRLSEISYDYSEINIEDLIEKEDIVVTLTHGGYIKRMPVAEYQSQHRGGMGVTAHKTKEDDFVETMFTTSTHDDLMFFTNMGKVYRLKGYEVPEAARMGRGRAVVNLLQLEQGEKVTTLLPVVKDDVNDDCFLMLATRNGLIKKTSLTEFVNIRRTGKKAIKLLDDDELIAAIITKGDDELIMASRDGKCIRFAEKDVRAMGRDAQGVKSIKLNDGDYVVDMALVQDGMEVLTVSAGGYGKRTSPDEYRCQGRAGKGIKAGVFNEKTGKLVGLKMIDPAHDIMMITDSGTIVRVHAEEISCIGRDTQGVRVMRIKGAGEIVSIVTTPHEDDEPEETENLEQTATAADEAIASETVQEFPEE